MKNTQRGSGFHVVTGAFGYSGSYIARALLDSGAEVRTLTSRSGKGHPLAGHVPSSPLDFENPDELRQSLRGASVLYNTYWVRFSEAGFSQDQAIRNTKLLFACARDAGVERIVHVSITHPSIDSPYEYFRGKAELEAALEESGVPHTVLRPAVIFGGDDILINNIAWSLRHLPVFGVFGDGQYKLQPIHVEDLARLAVCAGRAVDNEVVQAVGGESTTYRELVQSLARAMGIWRPLISVPTWFGMLASRLIGLAVRDVTLTREEVGALMDNLLVTDHSPQVGPDENVRVLLSEWMKDEAATLGRSYANELGRRKEQPRLATAEQPA